MDLSTLIGIVLGFVIIVASITMDDIKAINNFINMPSLFIVVGGTIMAIVASYPFSILKNIFVGIFHDFLLGSGSGVQCCGEPDGLPGGEQRD